MKACIKSILRGCDVNNNQFCDWQVAIGLSRTLRIYDESLRIKFEDEFNERLQKLVEIAREELNDHGDE